MGVKSTVTKVVIGLTLFSAVSFEICTIKDKMDAEAYLHGKTQLAGEIREEQASQNAGSIVPAKEQAQLKEDMAAHPEKYGLGRKLKQLESLRQEVIDEREKIAEANPDVVVSRGMTFEDINSFCNSNLGDLSLGGAWPCYVFTVRASDLSFKERQQYSKELEGVDFAINSGFASVFEHYAKDSTMKDKNREFVHGVREYKEEFEKTYGEHLKAKAKDMLSLKDSDVVRVADRNSIDKKSGRQRYITLPSMRV